VPSVGRAIFDTLEGDLAKALFSFPQLREWNSAPGLGCANEGSKNNDAFASNRKVVTGTNYGGILGRHQQRHADFYPGSGEPTLR